MKVEIEAKFLNIDFDDIRSKLTALGATCEQPMRMMRRAIIKPQHMIKEGGFIRLRDEGDKITLTYKKHPTDATVDNTEEIEVEVSDFDATLEILAKARLTHVSMQESKRETWKLGEAEVVLDEWPWLTPYLEIESDSVTIVQDAAKLLGFDWVNAVFGGVMAAYRADYPHLTMEATVQSLAEVRFADPLPYMLQIQPST